MRRLALYLDTTVWNYSFAQDTPERQAFTVEFFAKARLGLYDIYYSDTVVQ